MWPIPYRVRFDGTKDSAPERIVSHYAIERSLGAGGMGEVFLARDLALGRPVALKLIAGPVGPAALERFRREAEACARVQHPAIATFYEAGEGDGVAFLAMEFVPGETLRSRLVRGRLEAAEALALSDALLEGLTHAHAAGVLHRDIKPENVMVCDDGGSKLLDFGIARLLDAPVGDDTGEDATAVALTEEGSVLGTLGYMSPEQLRARPLDERSDVFSLAATLYEALSGRAAFPGRTPGERVAAILSEDGPPFDRDAIPAELAPVLRRALARNRDARYDSAASFLADLRSAASGEYVAALPDSVAVLDFQNLSSNPEDAWIGSGIAESVGADLAAIDGLTVFSRDTVVKARSSLGSPGTPAEAVELGHALGCRWVLAGAYQRAGESLRVTSRLTEVSTRSVVATEKLDGRLDGIFVIQDRLAQSVAERLRRTRAGVAPRTAPTKKLEAYEAHARGRRFFFRLEKGGLDQARGLYEDALRADPHYAPALGDLAAVHAMRYTFTTDAKELALARGYAERAIREDPEAGGPRIWLAYACWRQGRADEAVEHARRAAELSPADPFGPYFAGCALSAGRRWAESIPLFQGALAADEQHGWSWLGLGWAQLETGKRVEARWCLEKAVALERLKARHPTA
ncbi:MAG TPA: protein kinase, partial [Myxococcota bacterium]|nr:protein kinase [Myxococcota bacterium]